MTIRLFIIPVAVLCLSACGRPGRRQHADTPGSSIAAAPPTGDFYKRYEGTIAGKAFVLHLQRYGSEVRGSYQFVTSGRPVTVSNWEDTTKDNILLLSEISNQEDAADMKCPHWSLQLSGSEATGTWSSGEERKSYDVELHEAYPEGSYRLDAVALSDTARLFPGRAQPHAYVNYGIVMPAGNGEAGRDFISTAISGQLGFDHPGPGTDFRAGLAIQARQYFDQYREDLQGLVDSNSAAEALESFIYQYYTTEHLYVLHNARGWLVLEDITSDYTGGAHGNYNSAYLNLDVTGKRTWQIWDIIGDTLNLGPQLQDAAREYFKLKPGEGFGERLLVKKIPPTRNYYLTPTGITFVYNPYEIASYADGEVALFLPYQKLMPLLTPAFRERMGLQERSGIAMR